MTNASADDIWSARSWTRLSRKVRRLQERIFKAYRNGDVKAGQELQQLLLGSRTARLLAVRKVTERSKGRNTPGIDGVSRLSPRQKLELADCLSITVRPRSVRRTYIPKPGKAEKRPLGIPTIRDRATQELVRMALEPQLEVLMVQQAPDAYGFRPGRWRGDAAKALRNYLDKAEGRYVAVCDIEKCFDRLDHDWVLQRIETWPTMQCYLREVLRAGYMEDGRWHPSERGAPQGGPLSGLITNWALLGLEQYVSGHLRPGQRPGIIRYADDIRIVHQDPQVLQRAIQLVEEYLIPIGLNLHPGKTEIVSVRDGVAFLGYTLRQFARSPQQKKSRNGFITLVSPSKESQKRHYAKLARIVGYHNAKSQEKLIEDLNPVIRGWAQSYADMNASQTFSRLDHLLFVRLRRWAKRRHGNKSQAWLRGKYFNGGRPWVFKPTGPNAPRLAKHSETKIRPRAKVPKGYSPYDRSGWLRKSHPLALRYAELGKDISEVWEDLREEDIAYSSEEPCEVKVSRTVLKTSAGQEASTEFNAKKSY